MAQFASTRSLGLAVNSQRFSDWSDHSEFSLEKADWSEALLAWVATVSALPHRGLCFGLPTITAKGRVNRGYPLLQVLLKIVTQLEQEVC